LKLRKRSIASFMLDVELTREQPHELG
jgi:hypothetical protein